MSQLASNLFIVTGAPGAGKTTLLNAAAGAGMTIGQEAARGVIRTQVGIDGPGLQWRDPALFAELMLDRDIRTYEDLRTRTGPVLCDRGIPDLVAYARILNLSDTEHFARASALYRYNPTVFFAPPWKEIFVTDAERSEGWEHAQRIYVPMRDAYVELGYQVTELPMVAVADRLAFVHDVIGEQQ